MPSTQRQRRTLVVMAVAVVLLGILGSCGLWLSPDDAKAPRAGALSVISAGKSDAASPNGHAPFAVAGRVDALSPGQLRTLTVTVTNPDEVAYKILELTATPKDANADCTGAGNVVVSGYDAGKPGARTYVVPRKSSITIPLSIMMLNTASSQDACKNATFPLAFSGTATQGQGNGNS